MLAAVHAQIPFIPIMRNQPQKRIDEIAGQLGIKQIFSSANIFTTKNEKAYRLQSSLNPKSMYALFTSGSTGKPKGVLISENNMVNTILWGIENFELTKLDKIGVTTSLHFDISIFDIFQGLVTSTPIFLVPEQVSATRIVDLIGSQRITSIFSTPSLFSQISSSGLLDRINRSDLRRIISGGDFFLPHDLLLWMEAAPHIEIYNVWGPTETTIVNTAHLVGSEDRNQLQQGLPISIGRSTPRMRIRIMETDNDASSDFITVDDQVGELVVQGDSVGLGYLSEDSVKSSAFGEVDGNRFFRTGDLGFRRGEDFFIVGRSSTLLKYQGYRIDPREVEFHASNFHSVRNACLILSSVGSMQEFLVLLIEVNDNSFNVTRLKTHLRERLPQYMIPKRVIITNQIPFNSNGKLDRTESRRIAESWMQENL